MARKPFNPDLAVGGAGPQPNPSGEPLTVSQVTHLVKEAIEAGLPRTVQVVGQLSNVKHHSSGHLYFTLKDDRSELGCVMWRSDASRLKFTPVDGLDVVAAGSVSVYERSGRYQLYARHMEPRGVGALELAFRQLCEKLRGEGLFDERHKQSLPRYPRQIAVVTSESGAAVHDILDTLGRRFPCAAVVLVPVAVQGPGAAQSVAGAIGALNRRSAALGGIEVMIVGRGGGSAEDLWAFNEEVVARAIFASRIPVISAVGHESDVSVADFVADVRAATPTAAAELAVGHQSDLLEELAYRGSACARSMRHRIALNAAVVARLAGRRPFADPAYALRESARRCEDLAARMRVAIAERTRDGEQRLHRGASVLQRLAPREFLAAQLQRVLQQGHRLERAAMRRLASGHGSLAAWAAWLSRHSPAGEVQVRRGQLDALCKRLGLGTGRVLQRGDDRVGAAESRLNALSHRATLSRGFSITRAKRTGRLVRSTGELKSGDRLLTEFQDGSVESRVVDRDQGELFD